MSLLFPSEPARGKRPGRLRHLSVCRASILVGAVGLGWLLLRFFQWSFINSLGVMLAPLLLVPLEVLCALVLVTFPLAFLVVKWRSRRWAAAWPLLPVVPTFWLVASLNFTSLWLDANWWWHLGRREQVVARVLAGELKPNVSHNPRLIALPWTLAGTSAGGEIIVQRDADRTLILFLTFRGILDNFAGFIWTSDGQPPKDGDFSGDWFALERRGARWFWASAH